MPARIVVATDFSDAAKHALDRAVELAPRLEAELVVLHVAGAPPQRGALSSDRLEAFERLRAAQVGWATGRLLKTASELDAKGLAVKTAMRQGPAAQTIADAADELDADLVITGARGSSEGVFKLGSVAEGVTRHADCSVLVSRDAGPFRKVLIATDLGKASASALPLARKLAAADASFDMIHVVAWQEEEAPTSGAFGSTSDFAAVIEAERKDADADLARVAAAGGAGHTTHVGNPAKVILDQLDDHDLLVVGKRPGLQSHGSSVAERLVRNVSCSVLVARAS